MAPAHSRRQLVVVWSEFPTSHALSFANFLAPTQVPLLPASRATSATTTADEMKIVGRWPWATTLCLGTALHAFQGIHQVQGHGFLTAPKAEFYAGTTDKTAYSATIEGSTALRVPAGMQYGWGPALSAAAFTAAFGNSSYKTLREFVMKHQKMEQPTGITPECGRTTQDIAAQPVPDKVVWSHNANEGFTLSHEGPCEVWCDDERVFVEKNCAKVYPQIPAVLPYDRAKCVGKKRLQMVWLALHDGTKWQVYMNCVPLAGASEASKRPATGSADGTKSNGSRALASEVHWAHLPGTVAPSAGQVNDTQPTATPTTPTSSTPSTAPTPTTTIAPAAQTTDSSSSGSDDGNWEIAGCETAIASSSGSDDDSWEPDCGTSRSTFATIRPISFRPLPDLPVVRPVVSLSPSPCARLLHDGSHPNEAASSIKPQANCKPTQPPFATNRPTPNHPVPGLPVVNPGLSVPPPRTPRRLHDNSTPPPRHTLSKEDLEELAKPKQKSIANEVVDPDLVEKARQNFETEQRKLEEWRAKLKKEFGYA